MFPGEEIAARGRRHRAAGAKTPSAHQGAVGGAAGLATVEQAMRPEAPKVFEPANTRKGTAQEDGDLDAGFAAAAHTVEGVYSTQVQTHTSLETHGCLCEWDGDKLTAWVSTQACTARARDLPGAEDPASQRSGHHRVHGRRLRQQVRPRTRRASLCARAGEEGRQAGQADARSQGRAPGDRQSPLSVREGEGGRGRGRQAHRVRRRDAGAPAAPAPASDFPLPYIYTFPNRRRVHTRRLHQRRPAARDARARTSARLLRHRSADGRTGGSGADGPDRVPLKNLPPLAPNAMWREILPDRAPNDRLEPAGTRPAIRRPGRSSAGSAARPTGGAAAARGARAHCEIPPTAASSCAAARRTSAPARARSWR